MVAWSVELFKFDIWYELRTTIKAQALADSLIEMVAKGEAQDLSWMLHVDEASSAKGCGAGFILEKEDDIVVELSIKFNFLVSNSIDSRAPAHLWR